jgi:8-oxo-dGTP pyrophosphatase MutT (NUDIX family)
MEYSAGVIAFKDDQCYLIRNKESGEWGFPKGHLESGETARAAALRELFEEAGLRVEIVGGFEEECTYFMHDKQSWKMATYFLGRSVAEEKPTTPEEVDGYGWFSYEEAMRLLPHPETRAMLKKAFSTMRNLA